MSFLNGLSRSISVSIFMLTIFAATAPIELNAQKYQYFGTPRSDWAVFSFPTGGGQITWQLLRNDNPSLPPGVIASIPWGQTATEFIPNMGNYIGDAADDLVLYRDETGTPGNSYVIRRSDGTGAFFQWGNATTDILGAEGDYDGDGLMDPTIVRAPTATSPFQWWVFKTATAQVSVFTFGTNATDIALAGADYTGDGIDDPAVARIGAGGAITWHIGNLSGGQIGAAQWGDFDTDFIIPGGDYDGDGRADLMVWRGFGAGTNGVWYLLTSQGNISYSTFGIPGASGVRDTALRSGDYDGDGRTDIAVYRSSTRTFYVARSSGGVQAQEFGVAGQTNLPIASFGIF